MPKKRRNTKKTTSTSTSRSTPKKKTTTTKTNTKSPSKKNIIWQWSDNSGFADYDATTIGIVESAYQQYLAGQAPATLTLSHGFFGSQGGYILDFSQMVQTKKATNFQRQIRRVTASQKKKLTVKYDGPAWEWKDNKWTLYDDQTSDILERAYKSKQGQCKLTHGFFSRGGGYIVDFSNWTQTRVSTGYARKVRRVSNSSSSSDGGSPVWEYKDENGEWIELDSKARLLLDGSLNHGRSNVTLSHADFVNDPQLLDFKSLTMTSVKTNKIFELRRVPPPQSSIYGSTKDMMEEGKTEKDEEPEYAGFGSVDTTVETEVANLTNWKRVSLSCVPSSESCTICMCTFHEEVEDPQEEKEKEEKEKKETEEKEEKEEKEKEKEMDIEIIEDESSDIVRLGTCGHFFHVDCIVHCYDGFITCPCCGTVYGVRTGPMPAGSMVIKRHEPGQVPLSSFEKYGTYQINYNFSNGTQDNRHPEPGRSYKGTNRTAYFPDTPEGRELVKLFKVAWKRRLLFRVGTSVTTGHSNCVIWNGVHHKTNTSGGATNFGYPDEGYFDRVREELEGKGVTQEDAKSENSDDETLYSKNDNCDASDSGSDSDSGSGFGFFG